MHRIVRYFDRQTKPLLVLQALILVLLLGGIDYVTGSEYSFSVFYTLPITIAAWYAGLRAGLLTSLTAAVCWLAADLLGGHTYAQAGIPFWNAAVRMGFFTIITVILSELRASRLRQEELSHFIVHDLRSPLSVVMTGLSTLRDVAEEPLLPEQDELVQLCLSASDRMLTYINALLDLARLESRQMPVQLSACEAGSIVQAAVDPLRLWAGQKGITLDWTPSSEITTVHADRVLTERILVNLLSNAIKYGKANSEVSIQLRPDQAGGVMFRVRNLGGDLPPDMINRVFDKFAQVGAGGARSGSGLGLTFCRLAVEAQGGRIWAESDQAQGTVFSFTLPGRPPAPH